MALITIADYEDATNTVVEPEDEPGVQAAIDSLSAFIEDYTGHSFSVVEDAEVRCQSSYGGLIRLGPLPINEVTSVTPTRTNTPAQGWDWDDIDTIYGLDPTRAYDVVYSYGMSAVPKGIKKAALQLLVNAGGSLSGDQGGTLIRRRVGDVEEEWENQLGNSAFAQRTLDSYRESEDSWYLGPRQFPDAPLSFQQGG